MTVEELGALGVLGEQKLEEYGSRRVNTIKKFVADEGLEGHWKKWPKRSSGLFWAVRRPIDKSVNYFV